MLNRRLTIPIVLLVFAGLLAGCAQVSADGDVVKWNGDYTVEEGETIKGDLTLFNGDATIKEDGNVEGALIIWNGTAEVEGTVEGDLIVSNGDVYLGDNAWVQGDIVCSWNCSVEQGKEARVDGKIVEGVALPPVPSFPQVRTPFPTNVHFLGFDTILSPFFNLVRNVASALVVAALAVLVGLLLPKHTIQVGRTMAKSPWPSVGYGALTLLATGAASAVMILTLCLSPIAVLAGILLLAVGLYGWICFGAVVGERLLKAFRVQTVEPVWAAGLGTLTVSLIIALLNAIADAGQGLLCCMNLLIGITVLILGCAGVGAVVMTGFGSRPYPPTGNGNTPPTNPETHQSQ